MCTPADYLPKPIPEHSIIALLNSIQVPKPVRVEKASVTAQYHAIYRVFLDRSYKGFRELILRVAGRHLPRIKTENEAAILKWTADNTSIPVPTVLHYQSSDDNPISCEYILLSREPGSVLADMYHLLDENQLSATIDQFIDILVELQSHEWNVIGGLQFEGDSIVPGPVLEETFWQVPIIEALWPGETTETLNISGPFPSYVDYITAHIQKYIYAIERHKSLETMRDLVPQLHQLLSKLDDDRTELNNVKLRLAHKDLHMGNVLYLAESGKISSIIDWEFAGIVPFTRWDPVKAFLWNCRDDAASKAEQKKLYSLFLERCKARGIEIPKDAEYTSVKQERMQTAANHLRAIVEVCPRGQQLDVVPKWRSTLVECMAAFGVR